MKQDDIKLSRVKGSVTDEHKTMMRTKQMIYKEKRSKEAKKNIMTDANKRFDAMLMWIGDRIYVGL